ncbi:MAG: HAD family hydrolase [Spirochaetia bacterium]
MKRAVVFDLDGTLADTIVDLAAAVDRSLRRRNLPPHDLAAYRHMIGDGFRHLVTRALPLELRNEAAIEELRAEAAAYYAEHCLDSTAPYPGVPELLAALAERGVARAVLSNKPHELSLKVVGGLFAPGSFAIVRGETAAFPRKPDPTSALDITARLGVSPAETLYLGDSDVDMATARAAGMTALGAAWGFRGTDELTAAGADAVLAVPGELLKYL